ncbi:MAG: hypothetical protein JWR37_5691 [Mycobacterium sp.]|nr:hypothetical protein [Mycobacterium sp.]
MSKAENRISTLVYIIQLCELRLLAMPRQHVWTQVQVRDLPDSPYRVYPSEMILAGKAPHDSEVATRASVVAANRGNAASLLLLDRQQRLTSLSSVLRGQPVHDLKAFVGINKERTDG